VFALLTLVVVVSAIPIWVKAVRRGALPTTEVPHQPSRIVAPSDFFATRDEKEAVRAWEASRRESVGGRR
jgi:carbon starvation protein